MKLDPVDQLTAEIERLRVERDTAQAENEHLRDRLRHNSFCSAAGWPCPTGCDKWDSPLDTIVKLNEAVAARDAAVTQLEEARAALQVVPPNKLRALADWLDVWDRHKLALQLGVTEAEVPDFMVSAGGEVQRDLRRMAECSAVAAPERETPAAPTQQEASE